MQTIFVMVKCELGKVYDVAAEAVVGGRGLNNTPKLRPQICGLIGTQL